MTIYDIAERAGVSIATVSRVVNGSSNVSAKTKGRVLAVIEESGYTPNVFARGLGTDSMKTVGLLCSDIGHPFMAQAVSLLESALAGRGYDCILACTGLDENRKLANVRRLLAKRIDALVLISSKYENPEDCRVQPDYVAEAAAAVPVFVVNGCIPGERVYCTASTDFDITRDVTAAMLRAGRRHILFLSDAPEYVVLRRKRGYEAALIDAGIDIDPALEIVARNDIRYAEQLLNQRSEEGLFFDGVMATEDDLAIGALKFAAHHGISVPEDLDVCGYNNTPLALSCTPELTSIDNQLEAQCHETVENLLSALEGTAEIVRERVFPAQLVRRQTTSF